MASNWDKVKEEVTCGICHDLLNDPKILPCLHSFCARCLKQWSGSLNRSKPDLECPVCRGKVSLSNSNAVEELPSHFSAVRLVEIVRLQEQAGSNKVTPICQHCDEGEKAVSSCSECAIFLCDFCEKSHQRAKATKSHKIYTLDEMQKVEIPAVIREKVEMCPAHPAKPLELFCKCEDVLICYECTVKKHKNHDYDIISDVVENEKKILKGALPGIQQQIDEVEKAVGSVKRRRRDVKSRNDLNLRKLDSEFDILHAALDKRKKELREQLSGESKQNDKVLQIQEDDLCVLLNQLKSCWSFMDDKLERGVHKDVLAMKRSMLTRRDKLAELKKQTMLYPLVQYPLLKQLKEIECLVESISQLKQVSTPLRDYTKIRGVHCQLVTHYGRKKFQAPRGVTTTPDDEVVMVDRDNKEVIVFDMYLKLIRTFGQGSGDGKLNRPVGVAVGNNVIAVSEWTDHVVKKFSLQGVYLSKFGSYGSKDGQFNNPLGLYFNTKGLLYVVDNSNCRVQVFTGNNMFSFTFGCKGSNPGQFQNPCYIVMDSSDQVYVTDESGGGISVFSEDGNFINRINCNKPFAITIAPDDHIITCDGGNHCLVVFSPSHQLVDKFGVRGKEKGQFDSIYDIAINSSGTIFVTEFDSCRLQVINT